MLSEFNDEQNKKAKKTLDQAGVIRDEPLTGTNYLDPACQRQRRNHAFRDHPRQAGGVVAGQQVTQISFAWFQAPAVKCRPGTA